MICHSSVRLGSFIKRAQKPFEVLFHKSISYSAIYKQLKRTSIRFGLETTNDFLVEKVANSKLRLSINGIILR